jgi:type I restriction enzyme S subunit
MVNLIPKLRFPEFSGNWKSKKLEEVGTVINGLTYSPDDIHDNGILVLRSSNIKENQLSFNDNVYVNTDNYNAVKEDDILICVRNGSRNLIGKNALITKEVEGVAFGAFMSVYRSELNKFVFQLFATDTYYKIIQENLGATINSINNSDLKKFEFYFPLKDEQDKIADFLSKVDIKINQLSKKKELLEQYKKGIMQKIFNQEIRFKDDNDNEYEDWIEVILDDISTFENGKAHENEIDENGQYIVINSKFISTDGIVKKYTNNIICGLDKNDIVMVMSDVPNGKAIAKCYYIEENNKYTLNQRICKIKANENINSKYIYYLINRNPHYLAFDNGVSQTNLRKNDVLECPLFIPSSVQEQTKIANFLTSIDDKINHVNTQLENTKKFKKGLLQQMFVQ